MGSSYTPPVNLASPGPIGATTPAAITGTTITGTTLVVPDGASVTIKGGTSTTSGFGVNSNQALVFAGGANVVQFLATFALFNTGLFATAAGFCSADDNSGMTFATGVVKLQTGLTEKLRVSTTGVRVVIPSSASGLSSGDLYTTAGAVMCVP